MRPWLWFLTRTADCRIFQEMNVPDIVKQVFGDHGIADFKFELTGTYRKWTYCVQYRETDFNFVSRLMEQEGIYYYFKHIDGHDTLVLTDSYSGHAPVPATRDSFISPRAALRPELERISSWDFAREIQPGVYVHDDYDFERPSVELQTQKACAGLRAERLRGLRLPRRTTAEARRRAVRRVRGSTSCRRSSRRRTARPTRAALRVGCLFTLEDYPRAIRTASTCVVGGQLRPRFSEYEAMPEAAAPSYQLQLRRRCRASEPFRPQRATPKPVVQGPQTAVVVGPAGEEIYTDKYGRVKVSSTGTAGQEGREQLVLDPRVAALGRQELGRGRRSRASARR